MSVMLDKDAANTMPGSNDVRFVEKSLSDSAPMVVDLSIKEQVEAKLSTCILLVEDDVTLAQVEATYLGAHGYSVEVVQSGEQAVSFFDQHIPDLVVLDIELPGTLNGWNVLQNLRHYAHIPVLLTTSLKPDVRKYLRIYGESRDTLDHLPKPYHMQALLKRIERMLMIVP
jgi:DNA-binding response OmpR family regulator